MWWYVGKRILQAIPVFIFATLIIYALVFLRPGDPVSALFGEKPVPEATKAAIEAQFHLDQPFIVQWLYFLKGVVTFDLGTSFSGEPVVDQLARAFPPTFTLAALAIGFEALLGIGLGTIAGLRRNSWFDTGTLILSLILLSIPIFVICFVFQFLFGVKLGWAPVTVGGDWSVGSLVMPALILAIIDSAVVIRLTRASVIENVLADHVRTARAKGMSPSTLIRRHVMRNSLIAPITHLGVYFGVLMVGAVVTEGIFNIPGIGNLVFFAITRGETTLTVSVVTVLVFVYVAASLIVDLLYAALDPRIRYA